MEGDAELKLQKASSELIHDFEISIARYLKQKRSVQNSKTDELVRLLEPFQEWPQLLDPHLKQLVPPLISAFLGYLTESAEQYHIANEHKPEDSVPVPRGISRILYTLCKVRGYKVVSHFFNNEPQYLEPMLQAYDVWSHARILDTEHSAHSALMTWEEKYVMLLWISHLALTPFDLAAISSTRDIHFNDLPIGLANGVPSVATKCIRIAIASLGTASKEREAAGILLARVSLRPDVRPYRLLESALNWALASLQESSDEDGKKSIYAHLGVLSFLAGVVTVADSSAINPFLLHIFKSTQSIVSQITTRQKAIYSSAIARKLTIKLFRAITVHILNAPPYPSPSRFLSSEDVLEEIIDHLLTCLADKDTPVRYAASKALSVITAKLEPALATDIVDALVGSMEENVSWQNSANGKVIAAYEMKVFNSELLKPNLTAVNPLRWHGLVLALSQLLYRRSPPPDKLPSILNALLLALSFEQRSASGASIGTNVRDAACFGIWALARRYTTKELRAIDALLIRAPSIKQQAFSVIQNLANEIVVAACLDPSGNIRRGASAALQELIGRHPDTIEQGISIVQVVNYHAVALRSRALIEVSFGAADLNPYYWHALFDGLLGIRGAGAVDAGSRRDAATAAGRLCHQAAGQAMMMVRKALQWTTSRQVEERHGLILSLAAIVATIHKRPQGSKGISPIPSLASMSSIFEDVDLTEKDFTLHTLRPALTAEAVSTLISAFGSAARSSTPIAPTVKRLFEASLDQSREFLALSLRHTEDEVINAVTAAARDYLLHLRDSRSSENLITSWISAINDKKQKGKPYGMISVLGATFRHTDTLDAASKQILDCFLNQLQPQVEIETRVRTVRSLKSCIRGLHSTEVSMIVEAVCRCLDDYTSDQRGDIGSLLRLEAIDAVDSIFQQHSSLTPDHRDALSSRLCRLSVEKLDKVRNRAWACLQEHHVLIFGNPAPDLANTSDPAHFSYILSLNIVYLELLRPILTGLITSAASGSDSLLCASRSALYSHIESLGGRRAQNIISCLLAILSDNLHSERLSLPTLTVIAFLGDINVFDQLAATESFLGWPKMLTLLSKSHYKSTNVRKLLSCISCYSSLARIPAAQKSALTKLSNLLQHPYPTV